MLICPKDAVDVTLCSKLELNCGFLRDKFRALLKKRLTDSIQLS